MEVDIKNLTSLVKRKKHTELENLLPRVHHLVNIQNKYCGSSSLVHYAVGRSRNDPSIIKLLLRHGGDPNNLNCDDGISPLHLSILYELDKVFLVLLKNGGDPYLLDKEGKSCYDLAFNLQDKVIWNILMDYSSPSKRMKDQKSIGICVNLTSSSSSSSSDDEKAVVTPDRTTILIDSQVPLSFDSAFGKTVSVSPITSSPSSHDEVMPTMLHGTPPQSAGPKYTSTPKNSEYCYQKFRERVEATFAPKSKKFNTQSDLREIGIGTMENSRYHPSPYGTCNRLKMKKLHFNIDSLRRRSVSNPNLLSLPETQSPITNRVNSRPRPRLPLPTFTPVNNTPTMYSLVLESAMNDMSIVKRFGELSVDYQNLCDTSVSKTKTPKYSSYYNYLLLDWNLIKRINFSGDMMKSRVIESTFKFRQFVPAIFHVGTSSRKSRTIDILQRARTEIKLKRQQETEEDAMTRRTVSKVVDTWKIGSPIYLLKFNQSSSQQIALVNEVTMKGALGWTTTDDIQQRKITNWSTKQCNEYGTFVIQKCFSSFALGDGQKVFANDDL